MKKPIGSLLAGVLVLSLAANAFLWVTTRNQATEQAAMLADLQGQLEAVTQNLADANASLSKLEQDHATLLADTSILQAELDAVNQQPETSKPSTPPASKPSTPPASKPAQPEIVTPPSGGVFDVPLNDGSTDVSREDLENGGTGN